MALQGPLAGALSTSKGISRSRRVHAEASIDRKIKEAIPTSVDDDMHDRMLDHKLDAQMQKIEAFADQVELD